MDTKDLRIGNLLYADTDIAIVVAIEGLDENNFDIFIDHGKEKVIRVKESRITIAPIPLTDDFVVSLGLFDEMGNLQLPAKANNYKLHRTNGHVVLVNDHREVLVHFWDVKYLHRLQNLYYVLAKEELDIKW